MKIDDIDFTVLRFKTFWLKKRNFTAFKAEIKKQVRVNDFVGKRNIAS